MGAKHVTAAVRNPADPTSVGLKGFSAREVPIEDTEDA